MFQKTNIGNIWECFYMNLVDEKLKICYEIYVVTSWYQSLGLKDLDAPSGKSGLKLRK